MAQSNWYGDDLYRRYREAAVAGLTRAIGLVDEEAVRLITSGPKTGAVYTTFFFTIGSGPDRRVIPYGNRPPHQASAPGEAPASDTGFLVNNRTVAVDDAELRATVTFHAAYAIYLEFGTDRMEPRPFGRPALVNVWPAVLAAFAEEMRKLPI